MRKTTAAPAAPVAPVEGIDVFAKRAMYTYSKQVLEQRAIPDLRDGLLVSWRAILWSMHQLGINHTGGYKKSARVVGDVLGSWHPHSDSSLYQSMVKSLVQAPTPLVEGYGNWGSHVDSAAATRYCTTGDTLITTEFGQVPIRDLPQLAATELLTPAQLYTAQTTAGARVPLQLEVASTKNTARRATVWINSGKQPVVEVRIRCGQTLTCTANHPLLVVDAATATTVWRETGQLRVGDYVCLANAPAKQLVHSSSLRGNPIFSVAAAQLVGLWCSRRRFVDTHNPSFCDSYQKTFDTMFTVEPEPAAVAQLDAWALEITGLLTATPRTQEAFLAGFFADCATVHSYWVAVTSPNRAALLLAKTLLLANFGIVTSRLRSVPNGAMFFVRYRNNLVKLTQHHFFWQPQLLAVLERATTTKLPAALVRRDPSAARRQAAVAAASKDRPALLFDRIVALTPQTEPQWVYDLTVPGSHAFVANGFVAHNTECRLSEFADTQLLDPDYLAVAEYIPNFSEDRQWPLVLPAKLPTFLLLGNQSIAVGVAASSPPFELDGVKRLLRLALRQPEVAVTPQLCCKHLTIATKWGGHLTSSAADLAAFFATGKATLKFAPELEMVGRQIVLSSVCPGLQSRSIIDSVLFTTILNLPYVKSVIDTSDSKVSYCITLDKTASPDQFEAVIRLLERSVSYDVGVTRRTVDGAASFFRGSIPNLLREWLRWRIDLEKKVIQHLLVQEAAKLGRQELLLLAVTHLDIILEALQARDPQAVLVKRLKVTPETAAAILQLRLRQLHTLLKKDIMAAKTKILAATARLQQELKDPAARILATLKNGA